MKDEFMTMSSEESRNRSWQGEPYPVGPSPRLGVALVVALVILASACATTTTKPTAPKGLPAPEQGVASWYGQEFAGRTTANGEIFDPLLFTAAHRTLPFGTIVDVHNPKTNQTVRVRVNDRGPYIGNRVIDLSYAAAQQISIVEPGSGDIEMTVVKLGQGEHEPPAAFSVAIGNDTPAPQVTPAPSPAPITPAPVPAPQPAVVNRVQVVETHKQPPPSGKNGNTAPQPQPPAPAPTTTQRTTTTAASAAPTPSTTPSTPAPAPTSTASQSARTTPAPAPAPAPSTPAPSPAPSTSTPAPTPGGRYVIQVGAFSQEENAKILQEKLTRIGQQSYVDHGSLYFVRVGPFATRDQAVRVREKLEAAGISALITVSK